MNEEQKEKYNDFLNMVCEVLGVNKSVDVLKVCAISDEYITPLQNQIKQLGERCLQLQKDKGNLIDENNELKAQIEKMKCCYNCSKWYYGECEESPKSKTFFCADFKCDNWEIADD